MSRSFSAGLERACAAPRAVWLFLAGYLLVVFSVRVLLLPAASQDDAEQLIFAQTLAGGYNPAQPPLYTWLVWVSQMLFGATVLAVAVVKFACLGLVYVFLYLAARQVFAGAEPEDRAFAAFAGLAPLLLYYVAFDALFNYSNTVILAAACAATLYALLRLEKTGGVGAYLGFGLAAGVGLLAKYSYGVFIGALLVAGLWLPTFRARLLHPRFLLALGLALAVVLPHLVWIAEGGADLTAAFRARLAGAAEGGYLSRAATGLAKLGNAVIAFLFPLFLVLIVLFPRALRRPPPLPPRAAAHKRLLEVLIVAAPAIIATGVLAFGVTRVRNHYMFILLAAPIYVFIRAKAAGAPSWARRTYALLLPVSALIFVAMVFGRFYWAPEISNKAYFNVPYAAIAERIRAAGFRRGTIVAHFRRYQIGGNLRIYFPDSRVLSTKYPYYVPPARGPAGQCLLVWDATAGRQPPSRLLGHAKRVLGATPGSSDRARVIEARFLHAADRRFRLGYMVVTSTAGSCR